MDISFEITSFQLPKGSCTLKAMTSPAQIDLRDLHKRLRGGRWRHQPIRRVHIPKGQGKTRPLGISCLEDKIVQEAVREILEALYEPRCRGRHFRRCWETSTSITSSTCGCRTRFSRVCAVRPR